MTLVIGAGAGRAHGDVPACRSGAAFPLKVSAASVGTVEACAKRYRCDSGRKRSAVFNLRMSASGEMP